MGAIKTYFVTLPLINQLGVKMNLIAKTQTAQVRRGIRRSLIFSLFLTLFSSLLLVPSANAGPVPNASITGLATSITQKSAEFNATSNFAADPTSYFVYSETYPGTHFNLPDPSSYSEATAISSLTSSTRVQGKLKLTTTYWFEFIGVDPVDNTMKYPGGVQSFTTADKFVASFDPNGGTLASGKLLDTIQVLSRDQIFGSPSLAPTPNPTRIGYTFNGWEESGAAKAGASKFVNKTVADGLGEDLAWGVYGVGDTVYVATNGGVSISTDKGASFVNSHVDLPSTKVGNQSINNGNTYALSVVGTTVYAVTYEGAQISTDGGKIFTKTLTGINGGAGGYWADVFATTHAIYVGTNYSNGGASPLRIFTNAGGTWTATSTGLGTATVAWIYAIENADPLKDIVYAATDGDGLGISTDGGATFKLRTVTNSGLGNDHVYGVYVVGGIIYAATVGGGLSISTDAGKTFTNRTTADGLGSDLVNGVYVVGNNVYVATNGGGLSVSTNGGADFSTYTTADGLGSNAVNGVYVVGDSIYVATFGGLSIFSGNLSPKIISKDTTFTASWLKDPAPPVPPAIPEPIILYPTITWANPLTKIAPYTLSSTELNAVCSVAGSVLKYTPAADVLLQPGTYTLSVTCTPPAISGYSPLTANVIFKVVPPALITWSAPAPRIGPYTLSSTVLNAVCNIPESTLAYSPGVGTTLVAGSHTLSVTCTPPTGSPYVSISSSIPFTVLPAPLITWATPATQQAPLTISQTELKAVCSIPQGVLTYSKPIGTVLMRGFHTLRVICTPPPGTPYKEITGSVRFEITKPGILPPENAKAKILTAKSSQVMWSKSPNGLNYLVTINGARVCVTANLSCHVKGLVGPATDIKVYATKDSLTSSYAVASVAKPTKPQVVGMIYFDSAKSGIRPDAAKQIKRIAALIEKLGYKKIVVSGHTDSQAFDNVTLAKDRAAATKVALAKVLSGYNFDLQVAPSKKPKASQGRGSGNQADRRAEIAIW